MSLKKTIMAIVAASAPGIADAAVCEYDSQCRGNEYCDTYYYECVPFAFCGPTDCYLGEYCASDGVCYPDISCDWDGDCMPGEYCGVDGACYLEGTDPEFVVDDDTYVVPDGCTDWSYPGCQRWECWGVDGAHYWMTFGIVFDCNIDANCEFYSIMACSDTDCTCSVTPQAQSPRRLWWAALAIPFLAFLRRRP